MQKRGWLGHRIEESRKEMENWPDWMKETAKFEGSAREGEVSTSSDSRVSSKNKAIVKASG